MLAKYGIHSENIYWKNLIKRFQNVPKLSKNKQTSKQTQFKTTDEPERVEQIVFLWKEKIHYINT